MRGTGAYVEVWHVVACRKCTIMKRPVMMASAAFYENESLAIVRDELHARGIGVKL